MDANTNPEFDKWWSEWLTAIARQQSKLQAAGIVEVGDSVAPEVSDSNRFMPVEAARHGNHDQEGDWRI